MIKGLFAVVVLAAASVAFGARLDAVETAERAPSAFEALIQTLLQESGAPGAEPVELEGTLEVLVEDYADGNSRELFFLGSDAGHILALFFASQPPDLLTGSRVRVKGLRVGGAIAIESEARDLERSHTLKTLSTLPNTLGAQNTAVILVKFQDSQNAPWLTAAAAQSVILSDDPTSVSSLFREASYGQTWLTGDVYGPYTIPIDRTDCPSGALASYAGQAVQEQVGAAKMATYKRFVYIFPAAPCSWAGLGTIGGNPSYAWINGGFDAGNVAHEMGHNFGLYHSNRLSCDGVSVGPNCVSVEYGDPFDVMGAADPMHFNAVQKDRLGWLNSGASPPITTVQASGVYTIDAYEPAGSSPKALKARTRSGDWYYLEHRQAFGFDAPELAGNTNVTNGLLVHLWRGQSPAPIFLLDMTAATPDPSKPALGVGDSFSDPVAGITIAPVSVTGGTAMVRVTLGGTPPPTCTHVSPAIGVTSSATGSVAHGTKVTYTVSVTNKDASPCTTSTFHLVASAPSGWTLAWGSTSLAIGPGASASTTLNITSPAAAANGTYTVNGTATNSGATSASAPFSATYVVFNPGVGGGGTFSDNFDRANDTNLGTAWTEVSGDLVISGNALKNAPGVASHKAIVASLSGATQTVSADFMSPNNNQGPVFGLILRYQNPTNYYMAYRQVGGSAVLRIARVVNGVTTILATAAQANPAVNVPFKLTARVSGAAIALDIDGVNKVNVNDAAFPTGKAGILINSASTTMQYQADNFAASAQ